MVSPNATIDGLPRRGAARRRPTEPGRRPWTWSASDGRGGRVDLLLVCSTGGHLQQSVALRPAWGDFSHLWVTFDKSDARSVLRGERAVIARGPTNRSIPNLLRNLLLAGASCAGAAQGPSSRPAPGSPCRSPGSESSWGAGDRRRASCGSRRSRRADGSSRRSPTASTTSGPSCAKLRVLATSAASSSTDDLVTVGTHEDPLTACSRGSAIPRGRGDHRPARSVRGASRRRRVPRVLPSTSSSACPLGAGRRLARRVGRSWWRSPPATA